MSSKRITACLLLTVLSVFGGCRAESEAPVTMTSAVTPKKLPPGSHSVDGRRVTIRLPYRLTDNLTWVTARSDQEEAPFVFERLDVQPGAGPNGTDLAIYEYQADRPGEAELAFSLVPIGKTATGAAKYRYTGPSLGHYSAKVRVD